ncbi:MAG: type I-E CRISPR-associated protein Cas6/Cse3/CasE [Limnochordia bacterium]|jgi:CRISPR system Cascade subunit CasE
MTTLHMVELRPDIGALLYFLRDQGWVTRDGDENLGYGIHAWFGAAFGEQAPRPWRLFMDRKRSTRILGYSLVGAEDLRQRVQDFATPAVLAVCPEPDTSILSKPMPAWRPGQRLSFEVQCCPVGRKATTGVEKDLYLIHADKDDGNPVSREEVYCDWVRERLERDGVTTVTAVSLAGFRLLRQTRKEQRSGGTRKRRQLIRPHALVRGQFVVNDADAFPELLVRGVGRHRSFGYGMLLLGPPS